MWRFTNQKLFGTRNMRSMNQNDSKLGFGQTIEIRVRDSAKNQNDGRMNNLSKIDEFSSLP